MNDCPHQTPKPTGPVGHVDEDTCLDLLHNLMPPDERDAILAHLVGCPECEALLRNLAAQQESARARHQLVVTDACIELRPTAVHPAARTLRWVDANRQLDRLREGLRRALASTAARVAAAGVAAGVVALLLIRPPGGSPAAEDLWPLPGRPASTQLRAVAALPATSAIMSGVEAYDDADYRRACERLGAVTGEGPLEDVRRVYLGSALAMCGRHAEAAAMLASLDLRLLPDPWGVEGLWTLSVALRKSGQPERARAILQELAGEPGPVGDRARAALP